MSEIVVLEKLSGRWFYRSSVPCLHIEVDTQYWVLLVLLVLPVLPVLLVLLGITGTTGYYRYYWVLPLLLGNLGVLLFYELYSMVFFGIALLWVLLSGPCSTMNHGMVYFSVALLYQGSSSEAGRTWGLFLLQPAAVKGKKLPEQGAAGNCFKLIV